MSSLIRNLGERLSSLNSSAPMKVHIGERELLIELTLGERKQNVRITSEKARSIGSNVFRIVSRACPARGSADIDSALRINSGLNIGSLALNTDTNSPVIDVVHCVLEKTIDFTELQIAIESVARLADSIEKQVVGNDVF